MTIFFTSDTHFGHNNIIDYCKRPFTSVEEMNERMVDGWNKTVKATDTVYHLGDVAFHNFECIERLNGKIKLVPGNHDHERAKKVMHLFDEVLPEYMEGKYARANRAREGLNPVGLEGFDNDMLLRVKAITALEGEGT